MISLIEKAHTEQNVSIFAEPDSQYGAEAFAEYERGKGNCETVPETTNSKTKNDCKQSFSISGIKCHKYHGQRISGIWELFMLHLFFLYILMLLGDSSIS